MKKNKTIKIIAIILCVIQLAAEGLLIFTLMKTGVVPSTYMALVIAGAAVLLVITGVIALMPANAKKKTTTRLIVGCIISAVVTGACVFASLTVSKIQEKVENIVVTDVKTVTSNIGIYTLADNEARSIADAGSFVFAINTFYDAENSEAAIEIINAENDFDIETKVYETPADMVNALYAGEADAMILNEAYMGVFEDLYEMEGIEQFKNITTDLKMIHEIKASREIDEEVRAEVIPEEGRLLMHSAANSAIKLMDAPQSTNKTAPAAETPAAIDAQDTADIDITKDSFILYLSGSDTRSDTLDVGRSDVNILLIVNPESKQLLLINTPRDYYVENPAGENAMDKLTHCGLYGLDCSVEVMENLYDIDINFYAQINFTGFEEFIDAIGGITVESETEFSSNGYDFVEGENEMDGAMAVAFVRERKSFEEGDNQRGINQMTVITAIVDKMSENAVSILGNFTAVLDSLDKMFVTNMTEADLAGISLMALSEDDIWEIVTYAVGGEDSYGETYSMPGYELYVMIPDTKTLNMASELIGKVLAGESLLDDSD